MGRYSQQFQPDFGVGTKWPPIWKRHCHTHFLEYSFLSWASNFIAVCCSWQWISIGSGNSLTVHRQQVVTWTNGDPLHWHSMHHPASMCQVLVILIYGTLKLAITVAQHCYMLDHQQEHWDHTQTCWSWRFFTVVRMKKPTAVGFIWYGRRGSYWTRTTRFLR